MFVGDLPEILDIIFCSHICICDKHSRVVSNHPKERWWLNGPFHLLEEVRIEASCIVLLYLG
jgi:hypothetical protein